LPVRAEITGGEVSDYKGFDLLVDDDAPAAKVFIADRGYDANHIRKTIEQRNGTPVIPGCKSRKVDIQITLSYMHCVITSCAVLTNSNTQEDWQHATIKRLRAI
jgi:transposase